MSATEVVRVAMWSGPRNISTALMRSFENRGDCQVVDEPFYGYYLQRTGLDHPGRDEIIATMECDWSRVAAALTREQPDHCQLYYQKHMTQHMLPEVDLAFAAPLRNAFLIREPGRMIASYARVRPQFSLRELGLERQWQIFSQLAELQGEAPPVLDAATVLANPQQALRALCHSLDIPYDTAMLQWPAGKRDSDGVWAPHWYGSVERSSGFTVAPPEEVLIPRGYEAMVEEAQQLYNRFAEYLIGGEGKTAPS